MGRLIGVIIIASIGLYAPFTWSPIVDGQHVVPNTVAGQAEPINWSYPGMPREVYIGHSPGIFDPLNDIAIGDKLIVLTSGAWETWCVTGRYVTVPSDLTPLQPTPARTLTLITCVGADWRLIVEAQACAMTIMEN